MVVNNEELITFESFNSKQAYAIGCYLAEKSFVEYEKLCVDIFFNGRLIYHFLSDACTPDNNQWLVRKRNTVLYFHQSTNFMFNKLKGDSRLLETKYGLSCSKYAIIPGGYPIYVEGVGVVGVISVSGQQPELDHNLIIEAIKNHR